MLRRTHFSVVAFAFLTAAAHANENDVDYPTDFISDYQRTCLSAFFQIAMDETNASEIWYFPPFLEPNQAQANYYITTQDPESIDDAQLLQKTSRANISGTITDGISVIDMRFELKIDQTPAVTAAVEVVYAFQEHNGQITKLIPTTSGNPSLATKLLDDSYNGIQGFVDGINTCLELDIISPKEGDEIIRPMGSLNPQIINHP